MKLIVEGVMGGKLPWNLVFIGAIIAVIVEIIRIPVLPFAIGIYLPVQLNACIMVGGLVLFGIIILTVLKFSLWKKRAKNNE